MAPSVAVNRYVYATWEQVDDSPVVRRDKPIPPRRYSLKYKVIWYNWSYIIKPYNNVGERIARHSLSTELPNNDLYNAHYCNIRTVLLSSDFGNWGHEIFPP
jgi:hypothetical protein